MNLRLLPALHGHRPKLNRAGAPIPDAEATPETQTAEPATEADQDKPANSNPEPVPDKPARRKTTKATPKKTAAAARKKPTTTSRRAATKRKPAAATA